MIRKAKITDAKLIHDLINLWAKQGAMLPRSLNYVYENIRDFWVYEKNKVIIGCCALHVVGWQDLGEIKSLAVAKSNQHSGVGSSLVRKCLKEAKLIGVKQVFTLTFVAKFFKTIGFKPINRKELPHKIWSDCVECVYFPDCKEEALILSIS